jgi:hypothetical protein
MVVASNPTGETVKSRAALTVLLLILPYDVFRAVALKAAE